MSLSSSEPLPARGRRGLLWASAVVVLISAVLVAARAGGVVPAASRRPAPAFVLPDLRDQSRTIRLSDLRGRPAVVNFFASWCVPCRQELPVLQRASERLDGTVVFLGIAHVDNRDDALRLLADHGVTFQAAFDRTGGVADGLGLHGLPSTLFVSAEGELIGVARGRVDDDELRRWLARLGDDGSGSQATSVGPARLELTSERELH